MFKTKLTTIAANYFDKRAQEEVLLLMIATRTNFAGWITMCVMPG